MPGFWTAAYIVVTSSLFFDPTSAGYCGTSAIPFSFEVLSDGGTVLGCARPDCFGWDPLTGNFATQDHSFGQVNGRIDGYMRQGPLQQPPFQLTQPQTSICAGTNSCGADQWVGGFNRLPDGSMSMICCTYAPLAQSTSQGEAPLRRGEIYSGGEMPGNQFDYISNVRPIAGADGQVSHYSVDVRRMSCALPIPIPPQPVLPPSNYVPQASYVPTSGYYCFAADSTVKLSDGRTKRMDELELTDHVFSPAQNFTKTWSLPLTGWLHKLPEEMANFIIFTTTSGKRLKLTDQHYIYRTDRLSQKEPELITAGELQIGDWLFELDGDQIKRAQVLKMGTTIQKGIFAPLTDNGIIFVDGIAASCYAEESGNMLIQSVKDAFVSCSIDSSECDVSQYGASLLLEMARLVTPSITSQ